MPATKTKAWMGPHDWEVDSVGRLLCTVPPERAPYGHLDQHSVKCTLRMHGLFVGSFCDCGLRTYEDAPR
jgi:hypothetical protein